MNFAKNIKAHQFLLLILVGAFLLRVNNLTVGFPGLYISNDEAIYHLSALNVIDQKTFETLGNYGPLGTYIQLPFLAISYFVLLLGGKVNSIGQMEQLLASQEGYLLFVPRVISATFGVLLVLVSYKLSKELFSNKSAALWTAFFTAVSFNLVHTSHLARAWSPAMFFSLLATLFTVRSVKRKGDEFRNAFFAYVLAALAFGFHQISGIVIFLIVLIRSLNSSGKTRAIFNKVDLASFGLWFFLILVFNYLSIGGNFLKLVGPANTSFLFRIPGETTGLLDLVGKIIANGAFEKVSRDLILTDGLMLVLGSLFFLTKEGRKRAFLAYLIFVAFNLFLVIFLFYPFLRYALVAIALMPIFAGSVVSGLIEKLPFKFTFTIILILVSFFNALYWNNLIAKSATFDQLRKWVDIHISPQTPIAVATRRNTGYVPTSWTSRVISDFRPGYYGRAAKLFGDSYPYNVRNVIYLEAFGSNNKIESLRLAASLYPIYYVIDSYYELKERLLDQNHELDLELVAHFSPTGDVIYNERIPEAYVDAAYIFPYFRLKRAGPYFDVLKIK